MSLDPNQTRGRGHRHRIRRWSGPVASGRQYDGVRCGDPLLGAAVGAAGGALGGALTDFGINDKFMKQLAESIRPGDAALFVLIKEMTADKVVEQISDFGGVVLKTSLTDAKEQALRHALASAVESDPAAP